MLFFVVFCSLSVNSIMGNGVDIHWNIFGYVSMLADHAGPLLTEATDGNSMVPGSYSGVMIVALRVQFCFSLR